ncbi:MAG: YceI family protein [Bacteroidota bacterium]
MKSRILFLLATLGILLPRVGAENCSDQLIIFAQPTDDHFLKETLPSLRSYCEAKCIELIEQPVEAGTPADIVSTPALVFQNHRGRSVYSSRYAEFLTIQNFIRTSRYVPQDGSKVCRKNLLLSQNGRTKIAASMKLTPLTGKLPKAWNVTAFVSKAKAALARGMEGFTAAAEVCLSKTDRLFYMDVHPYLDAEQQLYISVELYSKFSCKIPVYSRLQNPIAGSWNEMEKLFEEAGALFASQIAQQQHSSKIGDAFSVINTEVVTRDWEALGLSLPAPPARSETMQSFDGNLPRNWQFSAAVSAETPVVQFRFMAPLDRYVGEVKNIEGQLQLNENQSLEAGSFTAEMQSLTMGMEDFDRNVLKNYIKAYRFPASVFSFDKVPEMTKLKMGETTQMQVAGQLKLMKKTHPIEVATELTPIINGEGAIQLQVSCSFDLNITDLYGIKGPDGPTPARKTLQFDLNFLMKPATKKESKT